MSAPETRTPRRHEPASAPEAYPLRLIASQGGLGIELYQPLKLGPLAVVALQWSLPGVRFPVDLSGGVRSFSNRRGEVQDLVVQLDPVELSRWLKPRLRHVLGELYEAPSVWLVEGGIGIGLWCQRGTVAFDLLWVPEGAEARLVVSHARGAGFSGPALAQALSVVDTLVGTLGTRRGRTVSLGRVADTLLRTLLPELGVRAPNAAALWFGALSVTGDELQVHCAKEQSAAEVPKAVGRALGLSQLLEAADEALLAADPADARELYVAALDLAPRHPEICQLIAALDCAVAERREAALGLLTEALPVTAFGLLGAELLLQVGDVEGAELALSKQANSERYAPLGALLWTRFAELREGAADRLTFLERALAISPRNHQARWARLTARLQSSDANGALADAEHLEAAARGAKERYRVLVLAGELMQSHGFVAPAGKLFERAMRYVPAAKAALGLAESLIATGHERRALPLLNRAAKDEDEEVQSRACLVLGKLLASSYGDVPQAIAQVQRVTRARAEDAIEARGLEARWRSLLGDIAGAALAYARLYDTIDVSQRFQPSRAAAQLLEASQFALEAQADTHAAHRYAGLALRLCPRDVQVQAAYRRVAGLLAPGSAQASAVSTGALVHPEASSDDS